MMAPLVHIYDGLLQVALMSNWVDVRSIVSFLPKIIYRQALDEDIKRSGDHYRIFLIPHISHAGEHR